MKSVAVAAIVFGLTLGACGDEETGTPEERTCREVNTVLANVDDDTGKTPSEKNAEALEGWRDVWAEAKDAKKEIREPVQGIVDAMAVAADGGRYDFLEMRLDIANLAVACLDYS